jgi:hypothetical protein
MALVHPSRLPLVGVQLFNRLEPKKSRDLVGTMMSGNRHLWNNIGFSTFCDTLN